MKKIFYWSPHLSNVATIKNVINSAKSLKMFTKKDYDVSIIDTIGEWKDKKHNLNKYNVNVLSLSNLDLGNIIFGETMLSLENPKFFIARAEAPMFSPN